MLPKANIVAIQENPFGLQSRTYYFSAAHIQLELLADCCRENGQMCFALFAVVPRQYEEPCPDLYPVLYFEEQNTLAAKACKRHQQNHERDCPLHNICSTILGVLAGAQLREVRPVLIERDPCLDISNTTGGVLVQFVFGDELPVPLLLWQHRDLSRSSSLCPFALPHLAPSLPP